MVSVIHSTKRRVLEEGLHTLVREKVPEGHLLLFFGRWKHKMSVDRATRFGEHGIEMPVAVAYP